jgi:hypothetical protein
VSSFVDANTKERERLRALVARLADADLVRPVTAEWSAADMLGHLAFWDGRASMLAAKLAAGTPWAQEDHETAEVDSLNAAVTVLIKTLPPRLVAETALRLASDADSRVAQLPPERMWPQDGSSPLNCERWRHRAEHLEQMEAALSQ